MNPVLETEDKTFKNTRGKIKLGCLYTPDVLRVCERTLCKMSQNWPLIFPHFPSLSPHFLSLSLIFPHFPSFSLTTPHFSKIPATSGTATQGFGYSNLDGKCSSSSSIL